MADIEFFKSGADTAAYTIGGLAGYFHPSYQSIDDEDGHRLMAHKIISNPSGAVSEFNVCMGNAPDTPCETSCDPNELQELVAQLTRTAVFSRRDLGRLPQNLRGMLDAIGPVCKDQLADYVESIDWGPVSNLSGVEQDAFQFGCGNDYQMETELKLCLNTLGTPYTDLFPQLPWSENNSCSQPLGLGRMVEHRINVSAICYDPGIGRFTSDPTSISDQLVELSPTLSQLFPGDTWGSALAATRFVEVDHNVEIEPASFPSPPYIVWGQGGIEAAFLGSLGAEAGGEAGAIIAGISAAVGIELNVQAPYWKYYYEWAAVPLMNTAPPKYAVVFRRCGTSPCLSLGAPEGGHLLSDLKQVLGFQFPPDNP